MLTMTLDYVTPHSLFPLLRYQVKLGGAVVCCGVGKTSFIFYCKSNIIVAWIDESLTKDDPDDSLFCWIYSFLFTFKLKETYQNLYHDANAVI
jgi:hypothetical protein